MMNGGQGARNLLALYRALGGEESFEMSEKLILFVLITRMNEQNFEVRPGEEWLAHKVGLSAFRLRKHVKALVDRGELEVVKKHGRNGNTVYKVRWAERKMVEMEPKPAQAAKRASNHQPFSSHDNNREDSAALNLTVDEQLYTSTQDQSSYDNRWYEEVAFDIEEEAGASSPALLPTEEEKESIFKQWWQERQASKTRLNVNLFKSRALAHYCKEEEVNHYYQLYLQSHDIPESLKNRR